MGNCLTFLTRFEATIKKHDEQIHHLTKTIEQFLSTQELNDHKIVHHNHDTIDQTKIMSALEKNDAAVRHLSNVIKDLVTIQSNMACPKKKQTSQHVTEKFIENNEWEQV